MQYRLEDLAFFPGVRFAFVIVKLSLNNHYYQINFTSALRSATLLSIKRRRVREIIISLSGRFDPFIHFFPDQPDKNQTVACNIGCVFHYFHLILASMNMTEKTANG